MKLTYILFILLGSFYTNAPGENSFTVSGTIFDKESNERLSFSYVHLEELNRTAVADKEGSFQITNIPEGEYTFSFHRIGYKTQKRIVKISDKNVVLDIRLTPTTLSGETIEVIDVNKELTGANIGHASKSVAGATLRRNLGGTLAKTLSGLPGMDQRSLGNTPARPVIRGLGDERVIILQDGISTGDISDQSADHSVTVDPIASSEIQIAKGAAALAYGANAVGGIVNVVNNLISPTQPEKISGTGTFGGETVNESGFLGLNLSLPASNFVVNTHLNARNGNDTKTPIGPVKNTGFTNTNSALGVSYVQDWGYIGASFGTYLSDYGIPPDPNGHPNGVDIEMRKFNYSLTGEFLPKNSFISTIEGDFSINNYNHKEFETSSSIGTDFGLVTTTTQIRATHGHLGFLDHGSFGLWGEIEDYAVRGASTPDANSYKFGAFAIEEFHLNALRLETGLRFDYVLNAPKEDDPNSDIGNIRERDFTALSSSVSAIYNLGKGFSIGSIILHSFRAPSLEELYSEGPHLASFTFEIGNPELKPERSLAKELFTRWQGNDSYFEVALYHNDFSNFIYARNTGQANNRFPTLNNYQFVGTEALFYGFEVQLETKVLNNFTFGASASYTIARQDTTSQTGEEGTRPLPQIPPFKAKSTIKYVKKGFEAGTNFTFAAEQNRTGEFENPTASYFLTDLFAQYRFSSQRLLHTISLNVNNIFNEEYYNHLSLIKDLRPEPGRNFSLLYRLYF